MNIFYIFINTEIFYKTGFETQEWNYKKLRKKNRENKGGNVVNFKRTVSHRLYSCYVG